MGELKKKHLRTRLQRHTAWNHNTPRNVIASVKPAFNDCCKYEDLDANPLANHEKPTATPRVTAVTPEEEQDQYENTNAAFGLFLKSCILTGARPYSDLAKVAVTCQPKKNRRIMLCAEMETITRRLMLTALGSRRKSAEIIMPRGQTSTTIRCGRHWESRSRSE